MLFVQSFEDGHPRFQMIRRHQMIQSGTNNRAIVNVFGQLEWWTPLHSWKGVAQINNLMAHLNWQRQTRIRTKIRIPNLMATLHYTEHVQTQTQTRIPTPYFCLGQESKSDGSFPPTETHSDSDSDSDSKPYCYIVLCTTFFFPEWLL